jgi:4-alpha-glucanotransferase
MALTAVTTHDLPTLRGYWTGRDIEVKTNLGLYPDEDARLDDLNTREHDKQLMLQALGDHLSWQPGAEAETGSGTPAELSLMVHTYLARTPCRLVTVSLDDILEATNQQNMPGTLDAHPNWRQKTPVEIPGLFREEKARALARMF